MKNTLMFVLALILGLGWIILFSGDVEGASLPGHFDWRDNNGNWMTSVKSQGSCGSCWAFAAVGAVEAQFNIASGDPDLDLDLSEQYLVSDCCTNCGDCIIGGWPENALAFIRDEGITDEACFPYTAINSPCSGRCADWSSRLYYINETGYVPSDVEAIKEYLIEKGPLVASMCFGGTCESHWDNGIYRCTNDSGDSGHAVVIVGYDETQNYWIVRNSLGTNWNDDGYFNVGCGECSIENSVYYNTISSVTPTPTPTPSPCTWSFPWGIKEDPRAAFSRYLGQDCTGPIALPTGGEPSTLLVVWLYDESAGGVWKYWIPGYGGDLTQLESNRGYWVVMEGGGAYTWNLMP